MFFIYFLLTLFVSILTSSYGQVICASGWVQYGTNCYLINPAFNSGSTSGTWDQCNAYCPTSYPGATMLCVNNAAENDWMRSQSGGHYWIGYTDMLPYGGGKGTKQYKWVTGCSSTYINWNTGEPNNFANNEDYTLVSKSSGLWVDYYPQHNDLCGCQYNPAITTAPSFSPSATLSSSRTVAPSPRPTSSPTTTPSFRSSSGDVTE